MSSACAPLAITMGDPCGIGPEIIAKALAHWDSGHSRPCVVLGDPRVMRDALVRFAPKLELRLIDHVADARSEPGIVELLASSSLAALPPSGKISADAGRAAFAAIIKAIELAREKKIAGMVTAPIHKEALARAGIGYPGHTEILAAHGGAGRVAMMLCNDVLRTVLVTVHCSLREAIVRADFAAQLSAVRLAHQGARAFGIERPRVAVAGLNPHAGESGLFGDEEITTIMPAIEAARREGIDASGPWPGDTVFMQAREGRFDIVVAQYHDQGLIPIKYMGLENGVNITLGLPFVRTSPDHGTAFDIAGRGVASPGSLQTAIKQAIMLIDAK